MSNTSDNAMATGLSKRTAPRAKTQPKPRLIDKGEKRQIVSWYTSPDSHRKLKMYASEQGTSIQGVIDAALTDYFAGDASYDLKF